MGGSVFGSEKRLNTASMKDIRNMPGPGSYTIDVGAHLGPKYGFGSE